MGVSAEWNGFAIRAPRVRVTAADLQQRRERSERSRVQVQTQVRSWIEEQGLQAWLQGELSLNIADASVQALRDRIDQEFKGAERRWAVNYLSNGLERGRLERNWTVRVPPRVLVLRAPTPPLNAETFPSLTQVGAIDRVLDAYWKRCAAEKSPVSLEQVLISAIWHSALIGQERIRQVRAMLAQRGLRASPNGQWVWVEWTEKAGNWQRLVFDPLTALLALRWQAQHMDTAGPNPQASHGRGIWRVLEREIHAKTIGLRNFTDFLRCAQARWHYRLPPFLAEWARGRIASACLPPAGWWRWILDAPLQRGSVPETIRPAQETSSSRAHRVQAAPAPGGVADIRRLLRSAPQRANQVATRLRAHIQAAGKNLDRLDVALAQWMVDLLQPQGRKGARLSSARELLARVDRRLDAVLGGRVPSDVQTWGDALQALVQATNESQRNNLAVALRLLDRSVCTHRGWEGVTPDLAADTQTLVDAQLLTETQYRAMLDTLRRWAVPQDCIIAAILGYRCGLRRSEIRGLRWIDVQWKPLPLLFVRSHAGRALKRDSGRRVLVLTAFCPPDELAQLHRAHGAIQKLIAAGVADRDTVLLLSDHTEPDQPHPESVVFDPVTAAMREVCAEDGLRFHHLRHSAANHLLLQLKHDQLDGAARLLDPQAALGAAFIAARRRALFGEGPAQRPLLWAVAAFMGHATPQTTLGSYIHLLDALLGLAVRQAGTRPPAEIVGWLVGATANHVNVQHHHWGVENPWSELGAGWARKLVQRVQPPLPTPQKHPGVGRPSRAAPGSGMTPAVDTLLNITEVLDLLFELSKNLTPAAARRFVGAAQARRIHGWMQAWSQLRGKSPALKKNPARRNQPIRVGQLLLDRPRAFQRIQSKPLRALAQAWLDGWRSWWQQDAAAVEQALTLHWALHDSDVHAVVFTDVNDAVRWMQVIDALCLRTPHLPQVQWACQFEPSTRCTLPARAQQQRWARALGLPAQKIEQLPPSPFHRAPTAQVLGRLRLQDVDRGKARHGGLLTTLDAAAYVMTLSILLRAKLPPP